MPRFRRLVVPGLPHHVTQRGVRRQQTFFSDEDYRFYHHLAEKLLDKYELDIWAYCLMPNHVHMVVVPPDMNTMSRYLAKLHRDYARRTNSLHEWGGHLWQERFYSVVMEEAHTLSAMRYVELNPVRSGLVRDPEDWPWSSARANLGLAVDRLLSTRPRSVVVDDWQSYLNEAIEEEELDDLRNNTRIGRPTGSTEFIEQVEIATGRTLRKKARGPKVKGNWSV